MHAPLRWTALSVASGLLLSLPLAAQISPQGWPFGAGQAVASDKYDVYVAVGAGAERKLDVVMSEALYAGDWKAAELAGRTFSFAKLDYDPAGGVLRVRVVKRFGTASTGVEVQPRSYAITPSFSGGNEAAFSLSANSRYCSVNFRGADNETANDHWILHMLCLFVDPPETGQPDRAAAGAVVFTNGVSATALSAATTIYFPAGYHNLRSFTGGAPIADGILTLRSGQQVYLEGGAFVHGLIATGNTQNDRNQRLFGRGILSGRLHPWYNLPGYTGSDYHQIVSLGQDAAVDGVVIMESPAHGIVGVNRAQIANFQYIGWHSNNDGIRVGSGSEIRNSFIRAVDDHFYNFNIWVHDCVLWGGHNGAILTYGWGGDGSPTYNAGSSLLENIDIIHPEWVGLGNNNGIVAAQTGCEYRPYGYGGDTLTVVRDIRIDGTMPGLVNLKPRSTSDGTVTAIPVPAANLGYLGDLLMQNITVDGLSATSRIKGKLNATTTGNLTYFVQNVQFDTVRIGATYVTAANAGQFFTIEAATTRDITFVNNPATPPTIAEAPLSRTIAPGGAVTLTVTAAGSAPLSYQWFKSGSAIAGATASTLTLNNMQAADAGAYTVAVSNAAGSVTSDAATLALGQSTDPRLLSLSTRGQVATGSNIQIAGFVISGAGPRTLLIRGIGPGLHTAFPTLFESTEVLTDPTLTVYSGPNAILSNNDWSTQANSAQVSQAAAQAGAFPLSADSRDAALVASLNPGAYTVLLSGVNNGTGIGLVEFYDLDAAGSARLISISTRGLLGSGKAIMIPGLVVTEGTRRLLIRGVGPGLVTAFPTLFAPGDVVPNPTLRLLNSAGADLATNDNWSAGADATAIATVAAQVGAFPLTTGSNDATLLITLQPGVYTALVSESADRPGIALVEVYDAP